MKPSRHSDVGSNREQLLAAAEQLLDERGPAGFTLREAARRAGVSHAAPGYLFGDLRGLSTELAIIGTRRFVRRMERAERGTGDPMSRLLAVGTAYVEFARAEPQMFRLVVGNAYVDASSPELIAERDRSEGPLRRVMSELHGVETETPELLCRIRLAWSTVHGLANLVIDGPFAGPVRHERGIVADVLRTLAPALAPVGSS